MRIAKRIEFEKVKKIYLFSLLKKKIDKLKETKPNSSILNVNKISNLNFYLIIDCKDFSEDFFSENFPKNERELFLNENFKSKKSKLPNYFAKLGVFIEVKGCYLIATTKKNVNKISIYNSSNTVSCKFDLDNLPNEFEEICEEYQKYNIQNNLNPYLFHFFETSPFEMDKIIESILRGINSKEIPKYNFQSNSNENIYGVEVEKLKSDSLENTIEYKIKKINDVSFLENVMDLAIESDNFELCAKIRDRLKEIK